MNELTLNKEKKGKQFSLTSLMYGKKCYQIVSKVKVTHVHARAECMRTCDQNQLQLIKKVVEYAGVFIEKIWGDQIGCVCEMELVDNCGIG